MVLAHQTNVVRPDQLVLFRSNGYVPRTSALSIGRSVSCLDPHDPTSGKMQVGNRRRTSAQSSQSRMSSDFHSANSTSLSCDINKFHKISMALVGYSDSEDSDAEASGQVKAPAPSKSNKPAFEKLVDPAGPRKIKVDLPSAASQPSKEEERPAKRVRTGGGLSGFNALLPPPKRTTENARKSGLKSGVSLKTSSAAAFSREPVEPAFSEPTESLPELYQGNTSSDANSHDQASKPAEEVKTVGNAMRFRPLSVANKKKAKKPVVKSGIPTETKDTASASPAPTAPPPKPKVSLFSVSQEQETQPGTVGSSAYEPLMTEEETTGEAEVSYQQQTEQAQVNPNSLDAVATDLNLSAAERRQLFGRSGRDGQAVNITNFNMDNEYAKNEELRASGETVQHRAVRAVAPGKHSLKQLVNMASTQQEALEDSWAEGKRNRGEAGNKYGWGR